MKKCPNGTYYTNTNKICYDNNIGAENAAQNEIENIREYLLSGKNNETEISVTVGDVIIQITNSEIQKNNTNKNVSSIDLGTCEDDLRGIYKINKTYPLLIYKIDYYPKDSLIPIIGYEVYNPIDLSILNLSFCSNSTIKMNLPAVIDENNLYKYDPNSDYYTNSCYSYTTEDGTDITLKNRQEEYLENHMSLCENKCKYITYDLNNKQSLCSCQVKNEMETISEIMNNPNKLENEFSSTSSSSSMLSMECTYMLFSLDGLKTNISSYLLISIIFYFLFSILAFVKCGFPSLKLKMKKIINSKGKQNINKINNQKTESNGYKKNNNKFQSKRKYNKYAPPKKVDIKFITNENPIKRYERVSRSNLNLSNTKRKLNIFNENMNENELKNRNNKNNINNLNRKTNNFKAKEGKFNLKKILQNYNFNDYELNSMEYSKALIFDKRSCCRYYISLLKVKQPLLFGFCPFNDYNTIIIKSCIFFLSFSIYYITNFFLFSENMIQKIYEDKGKYNILYFLPTSCISFAISHILTIIIKYIFLSERNINEIKLQVSSMAAYRISFKVERNIKIKYVIFFLFGLILLIIFWILLSSFGAVFQNSQIILIINTLISFGIAFIYPFFINVIPCLFRICSLSSKGKNLGCIYAFSKFLQII